MLIVEDQHLSLFLSIHTQRQQPHFTFEFFHSFLLILQFFKQISFLPQKTKVLVLVDGLRELAMGANIKSIFYSLNVGFFMLFYLLQIYLKRPSPILDKNLHLQAFSQFLFVKLILVLDIFGDSILRSMYDQLRLIELS